MFHHWYKFPVCQWYTQEFTQQHGLNNLKEKNKPVSLKGETHNLIVAHPMEFNAKQRRKPAKGWNAHSG